MRTRKMQTLVFWLTLALLLCLVLVVGCKKKAETEAAKESAAPAAKAIEQTLCPVMGTPINKDIYTEYQGKKVYFCCAECKEKFEKEPEKYLAKLPQFKEQVEAMKKEAQQLEQKGTEQLKEKAQEVEKEATQMKEEAQEKAPELTEAVNDVTEAMPK